MKLKDSTLIHCRKEVVWELLNDTRTWHKWNPKVQEIVPVSYGSRREGYKYKITYKMKGKKLPSNAEIVSYKPPDELIIACNNPEFNKENVVYEIYHITDQEGGTLLTQTIDLTQSGISLFWQMVMYLIYRFGKPTGMKYLQQFKRIAEEKEPIVD